MGWRHWQPSPLGTGLVSQPLLCEGYCVRTYVPLTYNFRSEQRWWQHWCRSHSKQSLLFPRKQLTPPVRVVNKPCLQTEANNFGLHSILTYRVFQPQTRRWVASRLPFCAWAIGCISSVNIYSGVDWMTRDTYSWNQARFPPWQCMSTHKWEAFCFFEHDTSH